MLIASTCAAREVLRRVARALLGEDATRSVGDFSLRPAQREAVRAAERALAEYGGALIADAPGTGKTVLALAIAADYEDVLVIVPSALREQWRATAERAGVAVRLESIEGLSQGRRPRPAPLIVVDEAHHLRTPTTARYRALAELAMHRRLLLLTATPVVNTARDRDALLALFLGERAAHLTDKVLAAVILRLASSAQPSTSVVQLPELAAASDVPGLSQALQRLPPPLPLADGAEATAILRLTLAFAWASSLAALDAALKRRLERGRTLDDQLAAGRWPSRDALRAWTLGDDATQLAFGFETPSAASLPLAARDVLAAHVKAVAALRALILPHLELDTLERARSLRDLLAQHSPRRIVLLSHSAVTVRTLYSALRREPGVVAITGSRVQTAAGRWSRDEVLPALGPHAGTYDAKDPRGIRLLIATDILAEGVELQAASVLVHADPAWTPSRLEQRVGRLAREGQREPVLVARFAVPHEAEELLQMRERLLRKASARVAAFGAPDLDVELRRRLSVWTELAGCECGENHEPTVRVAAIHSGRNGFLALVRKSGKPQLLAGSHTGGRWRVGQSPRALLQMLPGSDLHPAALTSTQIACVRRVLQRWHLRSRAATMAGDEAALPESILRNLRSRLDSIVARAALGDRARTAQALSALLGQISSRRGCGIEQTLRRLLRSEVDGAEFVARLRAVTGDEIAYTQKRPAPHLGTGRLSIEALLIVVAGQDPAGTQAPPFPDGKETLSRSASSLD